VDRHHFERDINRLLSDESITKLEYTFNNEKREPETIVVHPAPIIVTEGLFIFHYENIRKMIDLAIFIEAPNDVRLARRVRRDFEERGYAEDSVKYQWQNHVVPAEEQFLYPYKESADIIVDNTDSYTDELDDLVERLLKILNP
jgi:uridine kinase